jgi:hypothetical protein
MKEPRGDRSPVLSYESPLDQPAEMRNLPWGFISLCAGAVPVIALLIEVLIHLSGQQEERLSTMGVIFSGLAVITGIAAVLIWEKAICGVVGIVLGIIGSLLLGVFLHA